MSAARNEAEAAALCVAALEAVTPLGFDAEQTCAAVRARVNRFSDHPFQMALVNDPETDVPEPLVASLLEEIEPDCEGRARMLELAVPALKGLLAKSGLKRADLAKGALFLSLPQADAGRDEAGPAGDIAEELVRRVGLTALPSVKACRTGHTGFATCLAEAAKTLAAGQASFCLIGGVETYHSEKRLACLDEAWRLKTMRATDGFIPGEGAVFLVLETAVAAAARKAEPLAIVSALGFGQEPKHYGSDSLSSGHGLQQALQPALAKPAASGGEAAGRWILCDLNGESYRAAEWGIVRTRCSGKLGPIAALTHPADCLGDTGAASGGLLAAYALHAFGRGCAPAREALIWNASDNGARSAFLLSAPGAG
jgi:3-oxoacyl-[acyl-carrier-protein] synthase-1